MCPSPWGRTSAWGCTSLAVSCVSPSRNSSPRCHPSPLRRVPVSRASSGASSSPPPCRWSGPPEGLPWRPPPGPRPRVAVGCRPSFWSLARGGRPPFSQPRRLPMSHDNDPFAVHEPVTVIDQLRVRPGQRRAVLDLFEQVYKPLAAERGLEWLHTHCAPPFEREGAGGDIHIHWRYPSLGALWGARGVEETDPRLASFWRIQLAPLIESRTRQLGRPAPLRAFPVAGPEPAGPARIPGRREILFLRPRVAVPAADQPRWLAALDGLVGQQGIRACRGGFNAGGYTGREGEISCDLLLAEGAALPVSLIENSL